MTLVGIEEHWMWPQLMTALQATPEPDETLIFNTMHDNAQRLADLGSGRLEIMDSQGIDVSILSLTPPGVQGLGPEQAVEFSRIVNDVAAAAVHSHPQRFRALAAVPMSAPRHVVQELERAQSLGHVGVMVYGRTGDRFLDDAVYDDFFEVAALRDMPVFIHPQLPSAAVRAVAYSGFDPLIELGLATAGWGWHLDCAIAALRLILRGTLDRYPGLKLILGHWGEMMLFWTDRIRSLVRAAGLQNSLDHYLTTNFWVTASGMLNPAMLTHVRSVMPIERLMFSTDYPFQNPTRSDIAEFLQQIPADDDRAKFCYQNAAHLFGLN